MAILLSFLVPLFAIAHGASLMKVDPKIVGGRLAQPGEVPYQVSLQLIRTEHHFCGGVIINRQYVLTAAHCVIGKNARDISANVGTTDLRNPHSVHLIESIYIHEEYNASDSWINDIALLKLKSPFEFSALVSPVALPKQNQTVRANSTAVVSGYGLLDAGKSTTQLHIVEITIVDQTDCRKQYEKSFMHIYNTQICANDRFVEKGSCQGDSGGPLVIEGIFQLVGLVSWANGCADTRYPAVYTRVSSYIDWIHEHAV